MAPDQTPGIGVPRATTSEGEFERLMRELRDFNDSVREKAAIRLGEIGKKEAVQALIGRLNNDKSLQVQYCAAEALYKIGDPQAWPAIIGKLSSSSHEKVMAKCVEILGMTGNKEYSTTILSFLKYNGEVGKQAALGLGRLRDLSIVDSLIQNLNNSKTVNNFYVMALIELGTDVITKVMETSGDDRDPYRVQVLCGFGPKAIPNIAPYLNSHKHAIRSVTTRALANINSDDSTKYLCNIITTEKEYLIRMIALRATELRPATQVEGALIYVLQNDPEENIKALSAEIIGKHKTVAAFDLLCKIALRGYKESIQISETNKKAIISLGLLGDQRAIPTLGSLLLDCIDVVARRLAAEALANIKTSAGFEYLMSALGSDGQAVVRQASALALGQLHDRRAVDPLRQVSTSDPDDSVKEAAKSALKMF